MRALTAFCESVDASPIAQAMANSSWLFPVVETVHLAAMVLLVGSITAFDLRLLGLIHKREPASRMAMRLLPFTWTAFAIMLVTGALLFSADAPHKYCPNPSFQIKIALIAVAGLNMSVFHLTVYQKIQKWDTAPSPPLWAKMFGTFSVILWASVVVAGRWIGFI